MGKKHSEKDSIPGSQVLNPTVGPERYSVDNRAC